MQRHEDTVVYNVDYSLQEPHLILWGISWSSTPVALTLAILETDEDSIMIVSKEEED